MSGSEQEKLRARIDRAERRRRVMLIAEAKEARAREEAEARRREEVRIVADAKAARKAGLMPSTAKAKARPVAQPGKRPVLGERVVDDPLEPGAKLKATVNLAEHPLEMMLARRRLTQAQYEAGVRFRAIFEAAAIGPGRGIDPGRIKVDGGRCGDPLSDAVLHAQFELRRLSGAIGMVGDRIMSAVAGAGLPVSELAQRWPGGEDVRTKRDYLTMRLKEVLDHLAEEVWGARGPETGRIVGERGLGCGEVDGKAVAVANQFHLRRRGIAALDKSAG